MILDTNSSVSACSLNEDVGHDARVAGIRRRIIEISYVAKSAHLGSSLSSVEILDAIIGASGVNAGNVEAPDRSRLVMSKGHAAMAFYAALEAWKLIPKTHLDRYLQDGTALWGHVKRSSPGPA